MSDLVVRKLSFDKDIHYPAELRSSLGSRAPKTLYVAGNLDILKLPRLGLMASRQVNPACLLRAYELLDILSHQKVCVLGGWHSALEVEMLNRVSRWKARIVVIPAKGLAHYKPPKPIRERLNEGHSLILTHCSPRVVRVERNVALRRNRLLAALSDGLFVPCASGKSATFKLAAEAVKNGVLVATVAHEHNQRLVDVGATACSANAFRSWTKKVVEIAHDRLVTAIHENRCTSDGF